MPGNTARAVERKTSDPHQSAASDARRECSAGLRELNPKQPAAEFRPIQSIVDHAVSPRRFFVLLVSAFAGLGLLLAALGIYGVISYSVTRQKRAIGVRMALGASAGVRRQILGSALRLAIIGVTLGALFALAVAKLISSLLFATSSWDLPSYLGMSVMLLLVAAISATFLLFALPASIRWKHCAAIKIAPRC